MIERGRSGEEELAKSRFFQMVDILMTIMLGNWLLYIQKGQEKVGEQG